MPGPNIHISSMRHAAEGLGRGFVPAGSDRIDPHWVGTDPKQLAGILKANPNFASLGAVGPDLFFFLPDFRDNHGIPISSVLVTVLDFLKGLYDTLDPFMSKWEHYLGPISEDTGEEMSRLTGGMSETVGNISGELSSILITALEDFITQQSDWWSFFSLGLNQGFDEQAYFWSDMLHYRNTGQFARALWRNAEKVNSDQARAYALGYMTHVGTDVTGHAFVNSISGGPFRLHWQRHHLVENHMDAFWYLRDSLGPRAGDQYPQLTESALYYDIAFQDRTFNPVLRPAYPTGGTMRENWERKRMLDIDSSLPDVVGNVLLQSMIDVFYQGGKHPKILRDNDGKPSADLIAQAYSLLFEYLKLVTVDGCAHEPPDPPDVFPNLDFPTMSDPAGDSAPGGGGGGGGGSDGNFWDDLLSFLLSVAEVIAYIAEVAAYLATLPWAIAADITTYPLRLGLYYALELPLFHMLKDFRSVLVMTGYMLPMDDEITTTLVHVGLTDPQAFNVLLANIGDTFGGVLPAGVGNPDQTFRDPNYPHSHPSDEFRHPWDYPASPPDLPDELPLTTAGPHAALVSPAILFGGTGTDAVLRDRFENAATPSDADAAGLDVTPQKHLGDAVAFSEYICWLESRTPQQPDGTVVPLVEWNLDADRGYGYHCWDWNRKPDSPGSPAQPDPEGNLFNQPCTWPSQADQSLDPAAPANWNPNVPLQIHFVGPDLVDPGCQPVGANSGPPVPRSLKLPKRSTRRLPKRSPK
jgi:hypothetical protein